MHSHTNTKDSTSPWLLIEMKISKWSTARLDHADLFLIRAEGKQRLCSQRERPARSDRKIWLECTQAEIITSLPAGQAALLPGPTTSLASLTMGCWEAGGISKPSWLITQSKTTQPAKPRHFQKHGSHRHPHTPKTQRNVLIRSGSSLKKPWREIQGRWGVAI